MPSLAEERVKQLAKLKFNTICPNCGTQKKFGFGTVCIKFFTFVCNECKSSHQAISHRCKSLTMSSWSNDEVEALERAGNNMCRRTWLKHAPPEGQGGRPKPGDDINVYKRFIVEAYENKRYYGEFDPNDGMGGPAAADPSAPGNASRRKAPVVAQATAQQRATVRQPVARQPAPPPVSAPAPPVADLLDFADFSSAPAPAPTLTTTAATNNDPFAADFSAFQQQSSAPAPRASNNNANQGFANFDAFASSPAPIAAPPPAAPATTSNNNDPFAFDAFSSGNNTMTTGNTATIPAPQPPPAAAPAPSTDPFSFAAFGPPSSAPAPSPALNNANKTELLAKKPVMGGMMGSNNNAASVISSMTGSNPSGTGMQMPPSMNNSNSNMMMGGNMNVNNMNANESSNDGHDATANENDAATAARWWYGHDEQQQCDEYEHEHDGRRK